MATEIVRAADRADTYALRYNEANRYQLTANCSSLPLSLHFEEPFDSAYVYTRPYTSVDFLQSAQ